MAMMAMTTSSSISVNADRDRDVSGRMPATGVRGGPIVADGGRVSRPGSKDDGSPHRHKGHKETGKLLCVLCASVAIRRLLFPFHPLLGLFAGRGGEPAELRQRRLLGGLADRLVQL